MESKKRKTYVCSTDPNWVFTEKQLDSLASLDHNESNWCLDRVFEDANQDLKIDATLFDRPFYSKSKRIRMYSIQIQKLEGVVVEEELREKEMKKWLKYQSDHKKPELLNSCVHQVAKLWTEAPTVQLDVAKLEEPLSIRKKAIYMHYIASKVHSDIKLPYVDVWSYFPNGEHLVSCPLFLQFVQMIQRGPPDTRDADVQQWNTDLFITYHGTNGNSALSILRNGLNVHQSQREVHGRGCYVSSSITRAMAYTVPECVNHPFYAKEETKRAVVLFLTCKGLTHSELVKLG